MIPHPSADRTAPVMPGCSSVESAFRIGRQSSGSGDTSGEPTLSSAHLELRIPISPGLIPQTIDDAKKTVRFLTNPSSAILEITYSGGPAHGIPVELRCSTPLIFERKGPSETLSADRASPHYFKKAYLPVWPRHCTYVARNVTLQTASGEQLRVSLAGKTERRDGRVSFELSRIGLIPDSGVRLE